MLVDVDEQAVDDHLLRRSSWAGPSTAYRSSQLRVAQTTDRRGGGRAALPVQLDPSPSGAVTNSFACRHYHLVEQLQAEIAGACPAATALIRLEIGSSTPPVVGVTPHHPSRPPSPSSIASPSFSIVANRVPSLASTARERLTPCSHGRLLLPGSRFDHRLHLRQPFSKIAADHLVHVMTSPWPSP